LIKILSAFEKNHLMKMQTKMQTKIYQLLCTFSVEYLSG